MSDVLERIDKEALAIQNLMKRLIAEEDIHVGFLAELMQVAKRRLSELVYMKDVIEEWRSVGNKEIELMLGIKEKVYIKSKSDGEWMSVRDASLLEIGQTFTIDPEDEKYKLIMRMGTETGFVLKVERA